MASWIDSRATSNYSNIPEEDLDKNEASFRKLPLGHTKCISCRTLATTSVFLGVAMVSLTWSTSFGSFLSESVIEDRLGLAGAANGMDVGNSTEGDIRIWVCRDTNCDKFHPHGLVHVYTAFLNKCGAISSKGSNQTNGKYEIIGANALTLWPGIILTADHCNDNSTVPLVHHHPFSLMVGKFTDCCSFEQGGCGFKCIAFALNEVPAAYGEVGDIRIKICRNEDCDKVHPHGLVHEYTANLNQCANVSGDTNTKTNGKYTIIGATAATLAEGSVLTAKQCGNTSERVQHGAFFLVVGQFTECCSFRNGGCGFKCIAFKQAYSDPGANGSVLDNSTAYEPLLLDGWVLAAARENCSSACAERGFACDEAELLKVDSPPEVRAVADEVQQKCKKEVDWSYDFNPSICTSAMCCGSASCAGWCAYGSNGNRSCAAVPDVGTTRLCPCIQAVMDNMSQEATKSVAAANATIAVAPNTSASATDATTMVPS